MNVTNSQAKKKFKFLLERINFLQPIKVAQTFLSHFGITELMYRQ